MRNDFSEILTGFAWGILFLVIIGLGSTLLGYGRFYPGFFSATVSPPRETEDVNENSTSSLTNDDLEADVPLPTTGGEDPDGDNGKLSTNGYFEIEAWQDYGSGAFQAWYDGSGGLGSKNNVYRLLFGLNGAGFSFENDNGSSQFSIGGGDPDGALDLNNSRIVEVANPTNPQDAVNKRYVDNITDVLFANDANNIGDNTGNTSPSGSNEEIQFNQNGSFGSDNNLVWDYLNNRLELDGILDLNSSNIVGLSDPSDPQDAVNKRYLEDYIEQSIDNIDEDRFTNNTNNTNNNNTGDTSPSGSDKEIQFNQNGSFGSEGDLVWNYLGNRLGIGTNNPSERLDVDGDVELDGDVRTDRISIGSGDPDGALDLNDSRIVEVSNPFNPRDAVNKRYLENYVDNNTNNNNNNTGDTSPSGSDKEIQFNQNGSFGSDNNLVWDYLNNRLELDGILDLNSSKVVGVSDPTNPQDAANKRFVEDYVDNNTNNNNTGDTSPSGSDKEIQFNQNGSFGSDSNLVWDYSDSRLELDGVLDLNSSKVVGVSDPTNPQDAANKRYVDNTASQTDSSSAVPSGAIFLMDSSCPSGYTRFSELDGRFPRGASSYGGSGGSTSYSHGDPLAVEPVPEQEAVAAAPASTIDQNPPYLDLVYCQKN